MPNSAFLLNTPTRVSDISAIRGQWFVVAEVPYRIPLAWLCMFDASDLRPCTLTFSNPQIINGEQKYLLGKYSFLNPSTSVKEARERLTRSRPVFEILAGNAEAGTQHWREAMAALDTLKFEFLTIDATEVLLLDDVKMSTEALAAAVGFGAPSLEAKQRLARINPHVGADLNRAALSAAIPPVEAFQRWERSPEEARAWLDLLAQLDTCNLVQTDTGYEAIPLAQPLVPVVAPEPQKVPPKTPPEAPQKASPKAPPPSVPAPSVQAAPAPAFATTPAAVAPVTPPPQPVVREPAPAPHPVAPVARPAPVQPRAAPIPMPQPVAPAAVAVTAARVVAPVVPAAPTIEPAAVSLPEVAVSPVQAPAPAMPPAAVDLELDLVAPASEPAVPMPEVLAPQPQSVPQAVVPAVLDFELDADEPGVSPAAVPSAAVASVVVPTPVVVPANEPVTAAVPPVLDLELDAEVPGEEPLAAAPVMADAGPVLAPAVVSPVPDLELDRPGGPAAQADAGLDPVVSEPAASEPPLVTLATLSPLPEALVAESELQAPVMAVLPEIEPLPTTTTTAPVPVAAVAPVAPGVAAVDLHLQLPDIELTFPQADAVPGGDSAPLPPVDAVVVPVAEGLPDIALTLPAAEASASVAQPDEVPEAVPEFQGAAQVDAPVVAETATATEAVGVVVAAQVSPVPGLSVATPAATSAVPEPISATAAPEPAPEVVAEPEAPTVAAATSTAPVVATPKAAAVVPARHWLPPWEHVSDEQREVLAQNIESCRQLARTLLQRELDFNEDAVHWLDEMAEFMHKTGAKTDNLGPVHVLSSFLGECVIRRFGGEWALYKGDMCIRYNQENGVFPVSRVIRQIESGRFGGDSITALYEEQKALLGRELTPLQRRFSGLFKVRPGYRYFVRVKRGDKQVWAKVRDIEGAWVYLETQPQPGQETPPEISERLCELTEFNVIDANGVKLKLAGSAK